MIALIAAMQPEIKLIRDSIESERIEVWRDWEFVRGKICGKEVVSVRTGVGKVLSAIVTQKLIDAYNPSAVIMTGIAGSINPLFRRGDIIIGRDCIQHDMDASMFGFERGRIPYTDYRIIESDENLVKTALSYRKEPLKIGRILTGDQFISGSSSADYSYLSAELEGDAVEMEGAAAALAAKINGIPFLLIRIISDNADGVVPGNYKKFLRTSSKRNLDLIKHLLTNIG